MVRLGICLRVCAEVLTGVGRGEVGGKGGFTKNRSVDQNSVYFLVNSVTPMLLTLLCRIHMY